MRCVLDWLLKLFAIVILNPFLAAMFVALSPFLVVISLIFGITTVLAASGDLLVPRARRPHPGRDAHDWT
jgi:hypothetical protein